MEEIKDFELINMLRGSDSQKAMRHIMKNCNIPLKFAYQQAKRFYLSRKDAEDASQETMMDFYRQVQNPSFKLQKENGLKSYLHRICKNKLIKRIKDIKQPVNYSEEFIDQFNEKGVEMKIEIVDKQRKQAENELKRKLYKKLGSCQEVLLLYFAGETQEEMSKQFGITYGSMRNKVKDCREKLRQISKNDSDIVKFVKSRFS